MICCGKEIQDKYGCPNCNGDSLHVYQCTNCKKFWSESELDTKEVSEVSEFWGVMETTISICLACPRAVRVLTVWRKKTTSCAPAAESKKTSKKL